MFDELLKAFGYIYIRDVDRPGTGEWVKDGQLNRSVVVDASGMDRAYAGVVDFCENEMVCMSINIRNEMPETSFLAALLAAERWLGELK